MTHSGSLQHREEIIKYLNELSSQGWRTINLEGKSPDGIAIKDGKVVAIELLIKCRNGVSCTSEAKKKRDYSMFDEVLIKKVERSKDDTIIHCFNPKRSRYPQLC